MKNFRKNITIGCFLLVTVAVIVYLFVALYTGLIANQDTKVHSDVVMILGAKAYYDNTYNQCLVARMTHAADLYKTKYAPKILVSGGTDKEDNVNEASTMRKIAIQDGIPSKNILLETRSTSTYENFLFSKKILQSSHLKSIIIVTEPFHATRAVLVAKKLDFTYTISPAFMSPCWLPMKYFSLYFLKEPLAIILYKIENKL